MNLTVKSAQLPSSRDQRGPAHLLIDARSERFRRSSCGTQEMRSTGAASRRHAGIPRGPHMEQAAVQAVLHGRIIPRMPPVAASTVSPARGSSVRVHDTSPAHCPHFLSRSAGRQNETSAFYLHHSTDMLGLKSSMSDRQCQVHLAFSI